VFKKKKIKNGLKTSEQIPNERVITVGYVSIVRMEDYNPEASYFAHDVCWTNIENMPEMAFDHNLIVNDAIQFLRREINHEVTSELLPRKFTFIATARAI
jgi:8-oxo-dGTP diphosphatase